MVLWRVVVEYGVVLGCRVFIKDIEPGSLAAEDGTMKVGDTVTRVREHLYGLVLPW